MFLGQLKSCSYVEQRLWLGIVALLSLFSCLRAQGFWENERLRGCSRRSRLEILGGFDHRWVNPNSCRSRCHLVSRWQSLYKRGVGCKEY